jgi:uroporphyrinogen decarboxylase
MLSSRERFEQAMQHQIGDRPPIDIGGTSLTSMSAKCQASLRKHLGFIGTPSITNNGVDERILEWAGTDFRAVGAIIDLPSPYTRTISRDVSIDCWGVRREQISGYDEITHHPLKGATLQELRNFDWPEPRIDETQLLLWEERAQTLRRQNQYVVVAEHPVYGILELGCWMCGYDDFLMRLVGDPDFVCTFFERVLEIQLAVIDVYYSLLGPYIDLTTSGDDFGMQTGPLISPGMFDRFIAPYFAERIQRTKALAQCYYWHHTCGSVYSLLDQVIACGVDILNPLQTSAARMSPESLKAQFGDRLVLWGGVDVQHFLPAASPDEVCHEVRRLIQTFGRDGGYIMAPAHNMQDDIPPGNIVAWVETMHESTG